MVQLFSHQLEKKFTHLLIKSKVKGQNFLLLTFYLVIKMPRGVSGRNYYSCLWQEGFKPLLHFPDCIGN